MSVLVLVVPSGGPWMSNEAFLNVMERQVGENLFVNLIGHLLLSLFYGWIIAACIFRLPLLGAIVAAPVLAIGLWGFNYLMLGLGAQLHANELHTFLAHVEFGLFFAVAYKAWSVPRRRLMKTGRPLQTVPDSPELAGKNH